MLFIHSLGVERMGESASMMKHEGHMLTVCVNVNVWVLYAMVPMCAKFARRIIATRAKTAMAVGIRIEGMEKRKSTGICAMNVAFVITSE
jgi:uncharacterized membrane protein (DUF485 family)